ncbi:unnamed protein product [Prorocentrum cordatum]|uniref:Uncharacterized protein n=1 Tax=Prorocentrum cordatum TaxID=2364126 RepID=A0ABN9Y7M3_9DINO|nr:unnamed protein product [Polarella glacialis]
MQPFWAGGRSRREEEDSSVLPAEGYAEAPPLARGGPLGDRREPPGRPLFPAGAAAPLERRGAASSRQPPRRALPAVAVRADPHLERQFSNRHIQDKRPGAHGRAEELRRLALRGAQSATVARGADAFRDRHAAGYAEVDALQRPAAARGIVGPRSEDESSSQRGSSDSERAGRRGKRRRRAASAGGDVVVDFF